MEREELVKALVEMQDLKYKDFQKKLVPNVREEKIIGIRVPLLRKYAKSLAKENPQELLFQIFNVKKEELFYEERLIAGFLIGYEKSSFEEWKMNIKKFVEIIDNWGVCDSACSTMKIVEKNKKESWEFLQQFLKDEREYHIRFGVVMTMVYFVEAEYVSQGIKRLKEAKTQDYYAMMAVAWALSVFFVKFEKETLELLESNELDVTTHNKTIQKIRESNRVSKAKKDALLKLKR